MAKRNTSSGLGRGLGALLGDAVTQTEHEGVTQLPIEKVQPNQDQPRKQFNAEALADLAESIRIHGILQPITVRLLSSGYYQIISGERRWRAAREAELDQVPVIVIEADDRKVMELGLIENLQREDLNPMEEAKGYQTLIQEYGLTQEEVARQVGKSRPAVANAVRLLALPKELAQYVEADILSAGHARALLGLEDPAEMKAAADKIAERQLSVRQTEALVKALSRQPKEKPKSELPDLSLYLGELEKDLSGALGRKVKIAHKGKKGKIELEYYGDEDLEALLAALKSMRGGSMDG